MLIGISAIYVSKQKDADIHTTQQVWSALTKTDEKLFM